MDNPLEGNEQVVVLSAAFSPDGTRVITGSRDGSARLWKALEGTQMAVLQGHEGPVSSAVFSPDGTKVITALEDGTARHWAVGKLEQSIWDPKIFLSELKTLAVFGHDGQVSATAFSPDGMTVVTASHDGAVRLWDIESDLGLAVLNGHEGPVWSAAFSPNSVKVVTASEDGTARVWNASNAQQLMVLKDHGAKVNSATFSSDGAKVATASDDGTARLWNIETGQQIAVLRPDRGPVLTSDFIKGTPWVLTGCSDGTVQLWDAESSEQRLARFHYIEPESESTEEVFLREFTVVTSEELTPSFEREVTRGSFSPDASRVVTASRDGKARIWHVASRLELAALGVLDSQVLSASFNSDGTRIATAMADGTVRIWRALSTTQQLIGYAKSIVPRQLTPKERKAFFLE